MFSIDPLVRFQSYWDLEALGSGTVSVVPSQAFPLGFILIHWLNSSHFGYLKSLRRGADENEKFFRIMSSVMIF